MIDKQRIKDILMNRNKDSIYYVKVLSKEKIKNFGGGDGKVLKDRLIDKTVNNDEIDKLLENNLVLWIEEFETINSSGKVLYAVDEMELMRYIVELKFNGDDEVKSDENNHEEEDNEETLVIWNSPYKLDIVDDLLNVIKDDKELLSKLTDLGFSIAGFADDVSCVFKLVDKDGNELVSVIIPRDSNELIKYMRLSLFKEQIKSIVNKGV